MNPDDPVDEGGAPDLHHRPQSGWMEGRLAELEAQLDDLLDEAGRPDDEPGPTSPG